MSDCPIYEVRIFWCHIVPFVTSDFKLYFSIVSLVYYGPPNHRGQSQAVKSFKLI